MTQAINIKQHSHLTRLYQSAILTNEARLETVDNDWETHGDEVDCALLIMAKKSGFDREVLLKEYPQIASIPYESEQKLSASFHERQGKIYIFVKGAVETLLAKCSDQMAGDGTQPLNHERIKTQEENLGKKQYRVLAFAYRVIAKQADYSLDDLQDLTFLGLSAMQDALRPEAKPAIAACHQAGIDIVMITGDHPNTAFAIGSELNISQDRNTLVTGTQIAYAKKQGEQALDRLTKNGKIYARIEPAQKLDIVRSLIRNGHFVAVTGDGVNDAPALKHAHVGVAMGEKGTDVARESAEIILTDDNFASIVSGIEEGRTAYANIRKIIFFLISTSLAEIVMFLGTILVGLPIPLFATQLLWLNFATSIIQDEALAFEPAHGNELYEKPRPPKEPLFNRLMMTRIMITASIMGMLSFSEFYWMLNYGNYSAEDARNILLLQFVLFENVIVLNSRSETLSFFSQPLMSNPFLIYSTLAAQAIHIGAMYTPGLSDVLKIHPVSLKEWLVLLGVALIIMVVIEFEKWVRRRAL